MNAEKLHTQGNTDPNLSDEQLNYLRANLAPEEFEKFEAKRQKALGKAALEAVALFEDKYASDEEYEKLLNDANTGDKKSQQELIKYQKAKARVAKDQELNTENLPDVELDVQPEEATGSEASKVESSDAEDGDVVKGDGYLESGMNKLDNDVLGPQGVAELIDNFDADHQQDYSKVEKGGQDNSFNFNDWAMDTAENNADDGDERLKDEEIVAAFESLSKDEQTNMMNMAHIHEIEMVKTGNILPNGKEEEIPRAAELKYPEIAKKYDEYLAAKKRLEATAGTNGEQEIETEEIKRVNEDLGKDFDGKLTKAIWKYKLGGVNRFFKKVRSADKATLSRFVKRTVALLFASGILATIGGTVGDSESEAAAKAEGETETEAGEGVYNEFAASGLTEKTRNLGNDEKLEDDFGQKTENKEDEDTNEKISSTAKFKIGGKEFVKESEKYKGGYKEHLDPYYDDDKHSEASMGGPAYDGEWKGTPKQVFESYESTLAGIKGSAEASGSIGMVIGAPGAENIKSKSMVNKFSNELRNGPSKEYDKYANGVADEVNNFLDGGRIKVTTIKAGESYTSTYTKKYKSGRLGIKVDEDVTHNYDVHMIDMFNKDGKSLFNNPEAKEKICELLGLPSDGNYIFGLALECGGNQITAVEVDEPEIEDYLESEPEITADLESVPELDDDLEIIPDKPDEPEKPEEPGEPEPEPESGTPVTVVTIPEIPSDPDSTPTTVVFQTPTPEVTPTPEPTLESKGPDAHAGDDHTDDLGNSESTGGDRVEAEDRGNGGASGEEPGSAVSGTNEGTNGTSTQVEGLVQTETTPAANNANERSQTDNANETTDKNELVNIVNAGEAERNQ